MKLFTSGRDYRPQVFPGDLPAEATYVRVLVYAPDAEKGAVLLNESGLERYADLAETTEFDQPAAAIERHLHKLPDWIRDPIFVVYQTRFTYDGAVHAAPRFHAMRVIRSGTPGAWGGLHALGRIRVVSMSNPTDPRPHAVVLKDDGKDDAVVMPAEHEGPGPGAGLVEGVLPWPAGRLGVLVAARDQELTGSIIDVRVRLRGLIESIDRDRTSEDMPRAWMRSSGALRALADELYGLAATAELVETALQYGTD